MIRAIILAAGIGSRLLPLTQHMPKAMVRVGGKTILEHQVAAYRHAGIPYEGITVVAGHCHNLIKEHIHDVCPGVNLLVNSDYATTNNMYSLCLALEAVFNQQKPWSHLFISNGDCIYDHEIVRGCCENLCDDLICADFRTYIDESMKITCDVSGKITNIAKTISQDAATAVSIDLYKFGTAAIEKMYSIMHRFIYEEENVRQWTEVAFPELFQQHSVFPYSIEDLHWIEIDNHEDLAEARRLFGQ